MVELHVPAYLEPLQEHWIATSVGLIIAYTILRTFYRLYLHPLSKFPGPKLAAITHKYEFYHDSIRDGQYSNHIAKLHEIYGPIVRISPDELHCCDPNFIDQVYASGRRRTHKTTRYENAQGYLSARTLAGAKTHEAHRKRRNALNKYFSKASIVKFETRIHSISQLLCNDLLSRGGDKDPINLPDAYSCYGMDVITSYCFGQEKGLLKANDFSLSFRDTIHGGLDVMPIGREWPWICDIVQALPESIAMRINPDFVRFGKYLSNIQKDIVQLVESYKLGGTKGVGGRKSILLDMLQNEVPGNNNAIKYLDAEAAVLLTAGSDTVAWTLTVLTFHLLENPKILARLTEELKPVVKDPKNLPTWSALEQLPYLSAVILEGLRLSYGLVCRLARIAPDEALLYEGKFKTASAKDEKTYSYAIPPGAAISILTPMIHHNENIFPQSHDFVPERWLTEEGTRRTDLEKYLLSFSKGSRQCLGLNLAYCELYLTLTALVVRVFPQMKLFQTTEADIMYVGDQFVPRPARESKGVQALVL